ncbi:peptide/nickel transport system substrate-binding protein [Humibacillus xanthopallidus]|uniref:Peptide/nickel transport system substrate-binding protein n=1 Tax=Humibacillus xanthopallidus TaxID=412689 RepID=A0A543PV47_9MICO|nr:ABC transporter substrate-binding protein [Humibacillus xanthopallidus]TQN47953.1 peptide/nickel transport system substrate-binding protein [Humibacillus xanthopallidus]
MTRNTRALTWVAAIGAVGLGLTACSTGSTGSTGSTAPGSSAGAAAVRGGTLNMLGSGDVDYMDPNISYYSIGYLGLREWSRQLFTYPAQNGQVTQAAPDLAADMPTPGKGISSDGLTYTITLRSGPKWSTSPARQVTAADVVRGVKRTCNPAQPFGGLPDYLDLIVGLKGFCDGFAKVGHTPAAMPAYLESTALPGVVAKDDLTVQFTLTHPASYFPDMLTLPAFSPAPKEYDAYVPASADLAQHTISDGPYMIESYSPTKNITFTRNPAWSAGSDPIRKAYVDKIVVNETVTQDSTQQQLQTGTPTADMEWDNFPPPSQLPALIAQKDPNLNLGPTASTNPYVVFNTVSPNTNGAMGNVKVRQALSEAMSRTNIIQVLGGPKLNAPLSHVLPSNIIGGSSSFDLYPYNATKAKADLAAAGYPNGLTLKMLYRNSSQGSSKTFQTVQQDLSKIGVTVVGVPSPNADFYTKYLQVPTVAQRGVWDLAVAGWEADWYGNAALSFFNPLFYGKAAFPPNGSNFGLYDSAATNTMIQQAGSAKTQDEAASMWAQTDQQVMKDAPFFPITNPQQANYRASQVQGAVYVPAIQNFDPTNVWLSPDKQGG